MRTTAVLLGCLSCATAQGVISRLAGCNVTTIAGFPDGFPSPPGVPYINPSSGFVDGPASVSKFNVPLALAVNATGYIYVADKANRALRVISPSSAGSLGTVTRVNSTTAQNQWGVPAPEGCDPAVGSTDCDGPNGVTVAPDSTVYLVTNRSLYYFSPAAMTLGDIYPGASTIFESADSIAADTLRPGVLYVGDQGSNIVLLVTLAAGPPRTFTIRTLAGNSARPAGWQRESYSFIPPSPPSRSWHRLCAC